MGDWISDFEVVSANIMLVELCLSKCPITSNHLTKKNISICWDWRGHIETGVVWLHLNISENKRMYIMYVLLGYEKWSLKKGHLGVHVAQ